jgi:hypothetical protein
MRRFIGHYPLVDGLRSDGPLIGFRAVGAD